MRDTQFLKKDYSAIKILPISEIEELQGPKWIVYLWSELEAYLKTLNVNLTALTVNNLTVLSDLKYQNDIVLSSPNSTWKFGIEDNGHLFVEEV